MQFINYFFASVITFCGLIVGILLVIIAPEEQKPMQNYLIFARRIILFIIFPFLIFYYFSKIFYLVVLVLYFIFMIITEYKANDMLKKSIVHSSALGVMFFLSSNNPNLFAIESALIMMYWLPTASLIYNRKEKNHYRMVFYNIGFIIIASILFFV